MSINSAVSKVLETWYDQDHPLHLDPLHPAIGLAGEAGELLDLYKKERFKDGVSWWDCANCGGEKDEHYGWQNNKLLSEYTPKILDELGDWWYYFRILAYQKKVDLSEWILEGKRSVPDDKSMILFSLNYQCARLLMICDNSGVIHPDILKIAFRWFQDILFILDCTLDQLTELNYDKLKDGDHHGWKKTAP